MLVCNYIRTYLATYTYILLIALSFAYQFSQDPSDAVLRHTYILPPLLLIHCEASLFVMTTNTSTKDFAPVSTNTKNHTLSDGTSQKIFDEAITQQELSHLKDAGHLDDGIQPIAVVIVGYAQSLCPFAYIWAPDSPGNVVRQVLGKADLPLAFGMPWRADIRLIS